MSTEPEVMADLPVIALCRTCRRNGKPTEAVDAKCGHCGWSGKGAVYRHWAHTVAEDLDFYGRCPKCTAWGLLPA